MLMDHADIYGYLERITGEINEELTKHGVRGDDIPQSLLYAVIMYDDIQLLTCYLNGARVPVPGSKTRGWLPPSRHLESEFVPGEYSFIKPIEFNTDASE